MTITIYKNISVGGNKMKLELIETKYGQVLYKDLKTDILRVRKVYGSYGRIYFTYKKQRIFLDEFVPKRDGTLVLIR